MSDFQWHVDDVEPRCGDDPDTMMLDSVAGQMMTSCAAISHLKPLGGGGLAATFDGLDGTTMISDRAQSALILANLTMDCLRGSGDKEAHEKALHATIAALADHYKATFGVEWRPDDRPA